MSDLNAMVKGVLDSLDGAGALADLLAELGREREAVLLRRRWKAWQRDRDDAPQVASEVYRDFGASYAPDELLHEPFRLEDFCEAFVRGVDKAFAKYIKARFAELRPADVPVWARDRGVGRAHAVASTEGEQGWTHTLCGVLGTGYVPFDGVPKGGLLPKRICRQCRTAMPTAKLKPTEVAA